MKEVAGRQAAERIALCVLMSYIIRSIGADGDMDTYIEKEIEAARKRAEGLKAELELAERRMRDLRIRLMSLDSRRAGLHFNSFSLFSENTALAIKLCGLGLPSDVAGSSAAYRFDSIVNRYVFRNGTV